MVTRAGAATSSLRAKQELVRLLFGQKLSRKGPNAHRLLDHSIYSYADLRSAYLERVHELHPDKHKSQQLTKTMREANDDNDGARKHNAGDGVVTKSNSSSFLDLQEAWNRYDKVAKMMKKVNKGNRSDGLQANFTMFGVGCSFSDSEVEREMRNKIMDQASRGWFSAGELCIKKEDDKGAADQQIRRTKTSLLASDDLFEERSPANTDKADDDKRNREAEEKPRTSLVSHLIPPTKRR